jgi:hypothetical protein
MQGSIPYENFTEDWCKFQVDENAVRINSPMGTSDFMPVFENVVLPATKPLSLRADIILSLFGILSNLKAESS